MEKRVLNKLNSPLVVELYSTFQDYGTLYYQMEYVQGGELWTYMHEHVDRLSGEGNSQVGCHWSQSVSFFRQMVDALEYIHRRGVVHRDIKPENIMITETGRLKLVDFGTAKDLIQTDLNGQEFVGTPEFMSPRTLRSKPVGIDADLWALGVVTYQLFFGLTPFRSASPYLVFIKIKKGRYYLHWTVPNEVRYIYIYREREIVLLHSFITQRTGIEDRFVINFSK